MDKSWLLTSKAIRAVRECAKIIESERGVKLRLSEPEFLQQLVESVNMSRNECLHSAFIDLVSLADKEQRDELLAGITSAPAQPESQLVVPGHPEEIEYLGKRYPRRQAGKEFRGLYRGRPAYG
ncbi:hypothetical protein MIB92_00320 [Aestuariirhabdus sp. Z084]|uniref:hypothetical protein n=1 Tax=Aestuariirhabdus haliotis TaxID=2918751 RepID=UPI00201B4455|nr:hypothetical protein [Aestuariirhabdus haliotis]MCL6414080.1 hypothetical protein [Aestuariirhabdus haliotis]MCL6418012.1 hypothetical protein [Aestuariirhabdus haliotis]